MIERLVELQVEGFRVFNEAQTIPLDADIVLIYGPNGTGKTSLISALECAVTGSISDLERFKSDFPLCLANKKAEKCSVAVIVRDEGTLRTQRVTAEANAIAKLRSMTVERSAIAVADRRYFAERCLLSQAMLGRLFEQYQNDGEQALVTYLLDLLKLEPLERLSEGLFFIGHESRIKKRIGDYADLDSKLDALKRQVDELGEQGRTATTIEKLLSDIDDATRNQLALRIPVINPVDEAGWSELGTALSLLETEIKANSDRSSRRRRDLETALGKVRVAIPTLRAEITDFDSEATLERIAACRVRQAEHRPAVTDWLRDALNDPASNSLCTPISMTRMRELIAGDVASSSQSQTLQKLKPQAATLRDFVQRFEAHVVQEEKQLTTQAAQVSAIRTNCDAAAAAVAILRKELQEVEDEQALEKSLSQSRALSQLLLSAIAHLQGDACPVCGRNFQEINQGSLAAHIEGEARRLTSDFNSLEAAIREHRELQHRLQSAIAVEAREAKSREAAEQRFHAVEKRFKQMEVLLQRLREVSPSVIAFADELEAEADERANMALHENRSKEQEQSRKRLLAEFTQLDIASPSDGLSNRDLADWAATTLQEKLDSTVETADQDRKTLAAITSLRHACSQELARRQELSQTQQRIARLTKAGNDIEGQITTARALVKEANTLKADIINEVLDKSLNELWQDLFERLAKAEPFRLKLKELRPIRGKLKVEFEAGHLSSTSSEHYENPASVLSSGNLNTAALSLFLALNLNSPSSHHRQVLVLDDPVQNMDDLHVVNLAELLRSIARETGRQIVIAVHERPLFEYLSLEFSPANNSESLITIELDRDPMTFETHIKATSHNWREDRLRFA